MEVAVFKLSECIFYGLPRHVELKCILFILKKELPDTKMGWVSELDYGIPSLQSLWNNLCSHGFGNLNVVVFEGQRLDKVPCLRSLSILWPVAISA